MNPDQILLSANLKKANPNPNKVAYEFERNQAPASLNPIQDAPASLTYLSGAPSLRKPDAEPMALFQGTPLQQIGELDERPEVDRKDAPASVDAEGGVVKREIGSSMMNYPSKKLDVSLPVKDTAEPDPLRGTPASHNLPAPPTSASLFNPRTTGVDSKSNMRLTVSTQDRDGTVFKGVHTRLVRHVAGFLKGLAGGNEQQKLGVATYLVNRLVACHDKPQGFENMHKQTADLEFTSPFCLLLKRSVSAAMQGQRSVSTFSSAGFSQEYPLLYLKIHVLTTCFGVASEGEHLQAAYKKYLMLLQMIVQNKLRWGVSSGELPELQKDMTASDAVTLFQQAYAYMAYLGLSQSQVHLLAGVQWVSLLRQGKSITEASLYTLGTCRLLTEMNQLPMIPSYLFDVAVLSEAASVNLYTFQTAVKMLTQFDQSRMTLDIIIQLRSLWVDVSEGSFKILMGVTPPDSSRQSSGLEAMSAVGSQGISNVQQGPAESYNSLMVGLFQQLLHIPNSRDSVVPMSEMMIEKGMRLVFMALLTTVVGLRIMQVQRRYTGGMQLIMGTQRVISDLLGRYSYIMRLIRGFNVMNGDMLDEVIPLHETELIYTPSEPLPDSGPMILGGGGGVGGSGGGEAEVDPTSVPKSKKGKGKEGEGSGKKGVGPLVRSSPNALSVEIGLPTGIAIPGNEEGQRLQAEHLGQIQDLQSQQLQHQHEYQRAELKAKHEAALPTSENAAAAAGAAGGGYDEFMGVWSEVRKMKVKDLRDQLTRYGEDTEGLQHELQDRLMNVLLPRVKKERK